MLEPVEQQNRAKRIRPHVDREVWGSVVPGTADASGLDRRFARRKEADRAHAASSPQAFLSRCGRGQEGFEPPIPWHQWRSAVDYKWTAPHAPSANCSARSPKLGKVHHRVARTEQRKAAPPPSQDALSPHAHGQHLGSATPSATPSAPPPLWLGQGSPDASTAPPHPPRQTLIHYCHSRSSFSPSILHVGSHHILIAS